jgi:thymidine phosphorylase
MGQFPPTGDPEIGRRTSSELTAVRAALGAVGRALEVLEYVHQYDQEKDPAFERMAADLAVAQMALAKYRRTGRPRKAQEWKS